MSPYKRKQKKPAQNRKATKRKNKNKKEENLLPVEDIENHKTEPHKGPGLLTQEHLPKMQDEPTRSRAKQHTNPKDRLRKRSPS